MHRITQLIASASLVFVPMPAIAHDGVQYALLVGGEQTRMREDDTRAQYRQVVAFGRCVAASDRDGSIAYVRAAASGIDVRNYPALKDTQQHCFRTVARNAWQLASTAVRVGAVAGRVAHELKPARHHPRKDSTMTARTMLILAAMTVLPTTATIAQTQSSLVVMTNRTTGQDVVRYVPLNIGRVDSGRDYIAANDPESRYAQVVAYGRCVVARDRDGSIAYVRAAASGHPNRGFAAVQRTSDTCRRAVAQDIAQLWRNDLRVSAIAEALRAQ